MLTAPARAPVTDFESALSHSKPAEGIGLGGARSSPQQCNGPIGQTLVEVHDLLQLQLQWRSVQGPDRRRDTGRASGRRSEG
jgi:hypothetical protein